MGQWKVANRIVQRNAALPALYMAIDEQTLTALQALARFTFRIRESDFLWTGAVAVSTGSFKTRLWAAWENRFLDNDFTRSNLFWGQLGSAGKDIFRFPPKFIPMNGELGIDMTDTSNAGNTVALYMIGHRAVTCDDTSCDLRRPDEKPCYCDRGRWGRGKGLMILNTGASGFTGAAIGSNKPFQDSITPDQEYHLRVAAMNSEATSDSWKASYEYQDLRHDRRVKPMSAQMRSRAWTGIANAPFLPPSPPIILGGSVVTFDGTELSGAPNTIHLSMIGERVSEAMIKRGD